MHRVALHAPQAGLLRSPVHQSALNVQSGTSLRLRGKALVPTVRQEPLRLYQGSRSVNRAMPVNTLRQRALDRVSTAPQEVPRRSGGVRRVLHAPSESTRPLPEVPCALIVIRESTQEQRAQLLVRAVQQEHLRRRLGHQSAHHVFQGGSPLQEV